MAHLIPERNDVVGSHDHCTDTRQAYAPPGVRIADVDEVLRWRRERRLETMTAGAPSHRDDLRLLGGGGVSMIADVVDRAVRICIPRNTEEGRGLRVMGTHPLRVEVGMLDEFHRGVLPRFFIDLVVLELVATLDFREGGHQGQRLIAHHAHVAEVTREALLMERTLLLVTVVVVAVPA